MLDGPPAPLLIGLLTGGAFAAFLSASSAASGPGQPWWTIGPTDIHGRVVVVLGQPAAWSVPLAFVVMILDSRATADRVPRHTDRFLVRLHIPKAPELEPTSVDVPDGHAPCRLGAG